MDPRRLVDVFGCAPVTDAPAIPAAIVRAHARRTIDALRHRLPQDAARALERPLADVRESAMLGWQPELGIARARASTDPVAAALQLIVALQGAANDVVVRLPTASSLYLDGWVARLPARARVRIAGDRLALDSEEGVVDFARSRDGWTPLGTACPEQRVRASWSATFRHFVGPGCEGSSGVFPALLERSSRKVAGDGDDAATLAALGDALQCLDDMRDDDTTWMRLVTHSVWFSAGKGAVASSSPSFPGVIALRQGGTGDGYLEAIVSSVAQQKLHQLLLVAPLVPDGAEEIHYVPASRTYTTTRQALAAAFEHAQVARLLRAAADTGTRMAEPLRRRALRRVLRLDAGCASVLDGSKALGPLATVLWEDIKDVCVDTVRPKGSTRR